MIAPRRSDETLTFVMPPNGVQRKPKGHPVATVVLVSGLAAVPLGVIGWIWSADWRWAVTGLLVLLTLLIVAGAVHAVLTRTGGSSK